MATRFWTKEYVFLNSLGTPRAFGKVYSYNSGLASRANTYSDDGLTTPTGTGSADGQTLNLAGRLPIDVFLPAEDIKFIVTNADGTDSVTIDPVHGTAQGLSFTSASIFDYIPSGNHAGILAGTDNNDWSSELQNAFDEIPAGARLSIFGTINHSSGLTRTSPIYLCGETFYGLGRTALIYNGGADGWTFQDSTSGLRLQGIRFVGTSAALKGIVIKNTSSGGMLLDHISVEGFTNNSDGTALYLEDLFDLDINASVFRQSRNGIRSGIGNVFGVVNMVRVRGGDCSDCTNVGIQVLSGVGWVIDGVDFSGLGTNSTDAIGVDFAPNLTAGTNRQVKNCTVKNCYFESAGSAVNATGVRAGYNASIGASSIQYVNVKENYLAVNGDHVYVDYCSDFAMKHNSHGALSGGKYKANVTVNALRPFIGVRPRSDLNVASTTVFYDTNDINTLGEATDNFTNPSRSAVLMVLTGDKSNVTGNGTVYTIPWDSETVDRQNEQNASNGIFTAQKSGMYLFSCGCLINATGSTTSAEMILVTSNQNYRLADLRSPGGTALRLSGSQAVYMDAADTASITVSVTGVGADTSDVIAGTTVKDTTLSIVFQG